MTAALAPWWVRGSYRTAWHRSVGVGRRTACGTSLGYGLLAFQDSPRPTDRVCGRCARVQP